MVLSSKSLRDRGPLVAKSINISWNHSLLLSTIQPRRFKVMSGLTEVWKCDVKIHMLWSFSWETEGSSSTKCSPRNQQRLSWSCLSRNHGSDVSHSCLDRSCSIFHIPLFNLFIIFWCRGQCCIHILKRRRLTQNTQNSNNKSAWRSFTELK